MENNDTPYITMDAAHEVLRTRFGYSSFKPGQEPLVESILQGQDCLGVMPTGAGKSLCYQVPGIVLPGCAVVISPLVSLMKDQVQALRDAGVRADFVNSSLTPSQQSDVLWSAAEGYCDLLYVAPERLDDTRFHNFMERCKPALVAVDEAHCVSQWGQDFRPAYLGIGSFIQGLSYRPTIAAFTATATKHVREDIVRLLNLQEPHVVVAGFDRPNLHLAVEQCSSKAKMQRIESYLSRHSQDCGIVYCSTRKQVEEVQATLEEDGFKAARYHAGLPMKERSEAQQAFVNDDVQVLVATNAFGMGIDKSNVRFVIHHNVPNSLEAYYQEAGRAGRDGEDSDCLLLWNDGDFGTCRFFAESDIENDKLSPEEEDLVRANKRRLLSTMVGYCLTTECLRGYLMRYFGEAMPQNCHNCSNCEGQFQAQDVTADAKAIMRCVQELRGRYGKSTVASVLKGSKSKNLLDYGLDHCKSYGTSETSEGLLKEIMELLACSEYLEITEGKFPLVGFGPRFREVASPDFRLAIKRPPQRRARFGRSASGATGPMEEVASRSKVTRDMDESDAALFERLRVLRKKLANDAGVAPFIVFSDRTLRAMCQQRPETLEDMMLVPGIGTQKLQRYGKEFLQEIHK